MHHHHTSGLLPQKVLSFKKEHYSHDVQVEEEGGQLILNDEVF
jgi:hypothetical protein